MENSKNLYSKAEVSKLLNYEKFYDTEIQA